MTTSAWTQGDSTCTNLQGLRELDMRGSWYSAASFRPGRQLPHLRQLTLTAAIGLPPNAFGLGSLAQLPELREVELWSPYLDNAGILQQAGLGQVETLVLDAPKVTDDGVKFLNGWKNLEELTLRCYLTDAGIAPIAGLTQLRKLTIANTWITDARTEEACAAPELAAARHLKHRMHASGRRRIAIGAARLRDHLRRPSPARARAICCPRWIDPVISPRDGRTAEILSGAD